jgi:methionyl-tRNA formyltransferase
VRIVFFGTPVFAARILEYIVSNSSHDIVGVVSKPDAPKGRGQRLVATPVKESAQKVLPSIPVFQPEKASTPSVIEQLRLLNADLFVVVAYGEIISAEVLNVPKLGCYNIHASLLPAYRGAAPIQRAIMDGCSMTGISVIKMTTKLDAGDIVWQASCAIGPDTNSGELTESLCCIACDGILDVLKAFERGIFACTPQRHEEATFAPKIDPSDLVLDPAANIEKLHDRVRALAPHPGAYFHTFIRDKKTRLKVLKTHLSESVCESVRKWRQNDTGKLELVTPEGALVFDIIQTEGKAPMSSDLFLRGTPLDEIVFS